jgi:hypothetical protein
MASQELGYLRRCMDKRFGAVTRSAFEKATGLGQNDYWDESYPGGSALSPDETGVRYAAAHGAAIFGWQAHGNHCGGQPGVDDAEIQARLDAQITKLKKQFPGRHFRIFATEKGIDIKEV